MRIVIAPDGFKETLTAEQACAAMAMGVRLAVPDAQITLIPLADGGEGTVAALLVGGGRRIGVRAAGPLGGTVSAEFGVMPDERTAIVEMSAASGFELLSPDQRDPLRTSTYGTGELLLAAAREIAVKGGHETGIIVGVGGSATVDAGCGALQAVGVKFFERDGTLISDHLSGGSLNRVDRIDCSAVHSVIRQASLSVACDVDNPLCGANGSARVFAPQKGASERDVAILERNLEHIARVFERDTGVRVADQPRCGAAGGMSAGLHAALGAKLVGGADLILNVLGFRTRITGADLVLTGEGHLDSTTLSGKVVLRVAEAARAVGVPAIAVVGGMDPGGEPVARQFSAVRVLSADESSFRTAMSRSAERLAQVTGQAMREWSESR
jgi:glycerate kinase